MKKFWLVAAAAAGVLAAGVIVAPSSGAHPPRAAVPAISACSSGYVDAVIGGEHKCLHAGEFCSAGHEADYERYGFTCVNGRLQSGAPPSTTTAMATTPAPPAVTTTKTSTGPPSGGNTSTSRAPTTWIVRANSTSITVANWHIYGGSTLPTYASAIAHFGAPQSCTLQPLSPGQKPADNFARVRWLGAGIAATFITYGVIPAGGDACDQPAAVQLDAMALTARHWRTDRGLQVGDTVARLQQLYPRALPHNASFWIVTHKSVIGTSSIVPVFSSSIHDGRVSAFRFQIGAQGD